MASNESASAYVVRRFASRDVEAIEVLAKNSPEAAQWSRESCAQLNDRGYLAWVSDAAGTLLGFLVARVAAREAEILNLAVDPANRRRGIAGGLFHEALAEFRRLSVTRVFLEVRETNLAAISFYEKHEFVRTGERPDYYQHPREAAVLLMRKLTRKLIIVPS
jgi:ribosomal-protein-alanine acetyltransferase